MNRLLLVGHGRMGQIVESLAPDLRLRAGRHRRPTRDPDAFSRDYGHVDVAIDFTLPEAVPVNLPQLAARGINVVIGTTGWLAHEAALRAEAARAGIGVVASANFSLGMNLFLLARRGCRPAVRAARRRRRVDPRAAPRGQEGRAVGHRAAAAAGDGRRRLRAREIDVAATRAGSIPGTHTIGFDGPSETVTLTHTVRDRGVFARGALEAARWLVGRRGWFTMRDVLTTGTTGD